MLEEIEALKKDLQRSRQLHDATCFTRPEMEALRKWKAEALNMLTDDQLDFVPAGGVTLRQRLTKIDHNGY